jgi:PQQ-dependent dehydrogenase (methanol/ethanol family)
MKRTHFPRAVFGVAAAVIAMTTPALSADIDSQRLADADKNPADWLTYHGSYKSWHYSGLDQINTSNVKDLKVAWSHATPRSTRGLQSFPLVADGVLYYSGSFNQVFALDGATGQLIWAYKQKLNEDLVAKQTHSPYNRGIALGFGNVYMGTLDGKVVAIDMQTGKQKWETKLVDSEKLTVGFTGAPLLANGKIIIGSQGGEWPYRGPIFGVDAKTGQLAWTFFTVGGNDENDAARKTWGGDSWKTGGGGGWMAGGYDPKSNTVYWGTANPAPLYDWGGADWKTKGARPGDNLYTDVGARARSDTGKHSNPSTRVAARRVGLRQRGRRVRDARAWRQGIHRASEQGRLRVRLRSRPEGAKRLAGCEEHQFRQEHRPEDGRVDRPARHGGRQASGAVSVHRRRL